jgi:7-cyano-7-deazaguanine synthase
MEPMKVVLLLSGGLDSTVLLASALDGGYDVLPITFDYGQANRDREIPAAREIAEHYRLDTRVLQIPTHWELFGESALLGDHPIPTEHADEPDATTVPGRNLVFCSLAAAYAVRHDAGAVLIGANADDDAGYLDCRPAFITALDNAVLHGTGLVGIGAPFLSYNKQKIMEIGGQLDAPMHLSWSCYTGDPQPCGQCGACLVRHEADT